MATLITALFGAAFMSAQFSVSLTQLKITREINLTLGGLLPKAVVRLENGFQARNGSGLPLWEVILPNLIQVSGTDPGGCRICELYDSRDGVGMPEIAVITTGLTFEGNHDSLYILDHLGNRLDSGDCFIRMDQGGWSQDTIRALFHAPCLFATTIGVHKLLISIINASNPARSHIKVWEFRGTPRRLTEIGRYVHQGGCSFIRSCKFRAEERDALVFSCINNKLSASSLLILPLESKGGASPPYEPQDGYDALKESDRGDHLWYIAFPPSDVGEHELLRNGYNSVRSVTYKTLSEIEVVTGESDGVDVNGLCLSYFLNTEYEVTGVVPQDPYKRFMESMEEARLRKHRFGYRCLLNHGDRDRKIDWAKYEQLLIGRVRYWTGH